MKGIVMDINGDKVVVLTTDGQFIEVKGNHKTIEIGQEITINNKKDYGLIKRIGSLAAAIILLMLGSYGVYGYYAPYGYVNLDINPSVEITYNLYNKVINIDGLNDEGDLLVEKLDRYKFQSLDVVINKVVDNAVEENFIKEDEKNIVLLTITEKGKEISEEKIYQTVNKHVEEIGKDVELLVIEGDKDTFKEAKQEKISPGKLMLINRALNVDKNINIEEMSKKPVKEIMNIIKKNKEDNKEIKKDDKKEREKEIKENKNIKNNKTNNQKKELNENKKVKEEKNIKKQEKEKNIDKGKKGNNVEQKKETKRDNGQNKVKEKDNTDKDNDKNNEKINKDKPKNAPVNNDNKQNEQKGGKPSENKRGSEKSTKNKNNSSNRGKP